MNALTSLRDTALSRYNEAQNDQNEDKTLVEQAFHTALTPLRIATSRPAIKAYLTTLLFLFTSFILISISTTAYLLFYYNYIPQIGLTQPIHLQYESDAHPHATIPIDMSALISQQPYDIFITLHMPRTPSNMAAGNFMLALSLLPEPSSSSGPLSYLLNSTGELSGTAPLAHSRRSAILPYSSPVTSLAHKMLHLPIHLLSLKDLDASELHVSMFERLSFSRGRSNIPSTAYLEVQSQKPPTGCPPTSQPVIDLHLLPSQPAVSSSTLQIYSAQLHFHARFEGLRYYVYNYRIVSFLLFTSLFYMSAIISMAIVWAFTAAVWTGRDAKSKLPGKAGRIKNEDSTTSNGRSPKIKAEDGAGPKLGEIDAEDDSDLDSQLNSQALANLSSTERTFPTLGRNAQPLRYTPSSTTAPSDDAESSWAVQRDDATHDAEDEGEDYEAGENRGRITTPILSGESLVKDEDDKDDAFQGDSGIGTSMESEARSSASGLVRRRSSRGGSRGSASGR